MWLSSKKYFQLLQTVFILANRPYLSQIVENPDGTILLEFVQKDKTYRFLIPDQVYEERGMIQ